MAWIGISGLSFVLAALAAIAAAGAAGGRTLPGLARGIAVVAGVRSRRGRAGLAGGVLRLVPRRRGAGRRPTPDCSRSASRAQTLQDHLRETIPLIGEKVDLVVWPENAADVDPLRESAPRPARWIGSAPTWTRRS